MRTITDDAGRTYRLQIDFAAIRRLKADGVCRLDRLDPRSLNEFLSDLIETSLLPMDFLWCLCQDELIQAGCRSADDVEKVFSLEKLFLAAKEIGEEVLAFSLSRDRTGAISGLVRTFRTAITSITNALAMRKLAADEFTKLPESFYEAAISDDENARRVALATIAAPPSSGNTSGNSPDSVALDSLTAGASGDSVTPPAVAANLPPDTPPPSPTAAET